MKRLSGFICGVLVTVLFFSLTTVAFAALQAKNIDVHTGVQIYIDDKKFTPRDVNGNEVEVLLYNGTTYLPVRAIGEAYDKEIYWEDSTKSVYIGKHEVASANPADGKYSVHIYPNNVSKDANGEKVEVNFAEPVGLTQAEVNALVPGKSVIDFSEEVYYFDPVTVQSVTYSADKMSLYINHSDLTLYWSTALQMWVYCDESGAVCFSDTGESKIFYVAEDAVIEDWSSSRCVAYNSMTQLLANSYGLPYNLVDITVEDNLITEVYVYYHP